MKKKQKNSRKIGSIIAAIFFLAFVAIMDYPYVSRIINDKIQGAAVLSYEEEVAKMQEAAKQKLIDEAIAYNENLATGGFGVQDIELPSYEAIGEVYGALLAVGEDGIMGSIRIPKIDIKLPIYHGTTTQALLDGSGHLEGSSLPIGGDSTHTCISAHRGLPTKKMFTDLDLLDVDDVFYIDILGETLAYKIYEIETVRPSQVESLTIKENEDLATLITCTPYGINDHRLFVHGYRIPYEEEIEAEIPILDKGFWINHWWIPTTILLIIWMIFILYKFNHKND